MKSEQRLEQKMDAGPTIGTATVDEMSAAVLYLMELHSEERREGRRCWPALA
ncbi:MAG: hypothetical protein HYS81_01755 [Candidatus Aenigmatarchaeota archaeon]|nr:MAG: hypothetical protein HYS81_01755 [Candidatus Aenigmarchaeota archaeon]